MKKHKKCVVCKKKYIPLWYYVDIQHDIPHGSNIEIVYLSCGKCPKCAIECVDNLEDGIHEYTSEDEIKLYHNFKKDSERYNCLLKVIEKPKELISEEDFEDIYFTDFCDCKSFFNFKLSEDGYGDIGGYINFYDIKTENKKK